MAEKTRKKNWLFISAFVILFSSCSDDPSYSGEIPELPALEYESISGRYNTESDDIRSVELSSDGKFIAASGKCSDLVGSARSRAESEASEPFYKSKPYLFGDIVKVSDTHYELPGLGSAEMNEKGKISITYTDEKGEPKTIEGKRYPKGKMSKLDRAVCRTWNLSKISFSLTVDDKQIYNTVCGPREIWTALTQHYSKLAEYVNSGNPSSEYIPREYQEDCYPACITLTPSSYIVTYKDMLDSSVSGYGLARWQWRDEKKGIMRYDWWYNNKYSYLSNHMSIRFEDNTMILNDSNYIYINGHPGFEETEYYCTLPL